MRKVVTVVQEVEAPGQTCLLPWARRTRVGRRNLLTTASNGSANGLQVISDRLADNFSILPGHHGTGDNGDDGGEDNDGSVSSDDDDVDGDDDDDNGEAQEDEGVGGGIMSKSFAMFECGKEGAQSISVRTSRGRAREPSLSPSLSISVCPPPLHTGHRNTTTVGQTSILCSLAIIWRSNCEHRCEGASSVVVIDNLPRVLVFSALMSSVFPTEVNEVLSHPHTPEHIRLPTFSGLQLCYCCFLGIT